MRSNQLKLGLILSYLTQGITILSGIFYTPIMLRLLGQSEYGLYQLVYSVVSYLSLLSLGFSSGYIRFYSKYKVEEDYKSIAKLNGMYFIIFTIISIICLVCGIFMVANTKLIFGEGLTNSELQKSKILMAIMIFNMIITFINSVFTSYITAHERFVFLKVIDLIKAAFNPFLTLPLLILGYGSVGMVVSTSIITILSFVVNIFYSQKELNMQFIFKNFDFKLFKEMFLFTSFIFINMIVDQINWSVDKFLLGRMLGTVSVAIYGIAGQLNTMYMSFSTSISTVFIPRVNMLVAKTNEKDGNVEISKLFTKVGRIQFLILSLVISGYIIYGETFVELWAGKGYEDSYIIGLFLMIPITIPLIQNLGIEIQRAKNMHKARSIIYLFVAIGNVFISIPLIYYFGALGAAIGTALSLTIGNIIIMNIYYHKRIKLDMLFFWKEIFKLFPPVFIAIIMGVLINIIYPCIGWISLIIHIFIYIVIFMLLMWKISLNSYEKNTIIRPIKILWSKVWKK